MPDRPHFAAVTITDVGDQPMTWPDPSPASTELPFFYKADQDLAQWVGVVPGDDRHTPSYLAVLTIPGFATGTATPHLQLCGTADRAACSELAEQVVANLLDQNSQLAMRFASLAGLPPVLTPERTCRLAADLSPAPPTVELGLGDERRDLEIFYAPALDHGLWLGLLPDATEPDQAQLALVRVHDLSTEQPTASFLSFAQASRADVLRLGQGVQASLEQDVPGHLQSKVVTVEGLPPLQGLDRPAAPPDLATLYAQPDLAETLTYIRDQLALDRELPPMPTQRTYESAYHPPESMPPPLGEPTPPPTSAPPSATLLVAGSRHWEKEQWPHVKRYVGTVVQRAEAEGMQLIVGDNPQGVDRAVVQACHQQGVDCLVYGTGREPRHPLISTSPHCRYVQVQAEQVHENQAGGKYHEPEHERHMRLLTYTQRDERMVEHADRVLCLWNGQSRGTPHVYEVATEQGKIADLAILDEERVRLVQRANTPQVPSPAELALTVSEAPTQPDLSAQLASVALTPDEATEPVLADTTAEPDSPPVALTPEIETINAALAQDPTHAQFLTATSRSPGLADTPLDTDAALEKSAQLTDVAPPDSTVPPTTLPPQVLADLGLELSPDRVADEEMLFHFDARHDTALWIGVVEGQAEADACVTCVLAVQDLSTPSPSATLAPCYRGDFEQAYAVGQLLADALEQSPELSRFWGVAEGVARVYGDHAGWTTPTGQPVGADWTQPVSPARPPSPVPTDPPPPTLTPDLDI